jgi:hypothetical protein
MARDEKELGAVAPGSESRLSLSKDEQGLPMLEEKKIPEYIEASLFCALSALAALLGFLLVYLICILIGVKTV